MTTAFINGKFYTVNPDQPWAEALLVEEGRIRAVGSEDEVRSIAPRDTEFVDLEGRMAMPGIHDAHLHLLFSGLKFKFEARLTSAADAHRIIEELRSCHCQGPIDSEGNEWLIGGEYFPDSFGKEPPSRDFLDEAFPDQPVFLYDYSIHHGLANSRALQLAGVDESIEDSAGGRLVRDATGRLTGEMVEQGRWPVLRAIPDYPERSAVDAVAWAVSMCHKYGITSVQEASANPQTLRALRTLDEDGSMALRVAAHLVWREEGFGGASREQLDRLIEDRDVWRTPHVDPGFIKIWLDGAPLPPHMTQANLTEQNTVDASKILVPRDELVRAVTDFDAQGLTVKIHCAGEGAVRTALDAIAEVRSRNGSDGPAHEVAHAGFISDQDYDRLPELNVTAEMSPALWHIPEYGLQSGFKFNSVLRHGATMTVGSDWIITENPNLFPGLQGMLEHGVESIDLPRAIHAVTLAGAKAVNRAGHQGSLEAGKTADFIVLDRNLFEVPVQEIGGTEVLRTVFEGRTVYQPN
ncbi:amidohydrolase [Arthrobacter sp. Marseille-P9274]|uniref:amidohydrolase n=1 Tax=Arthrobacter sp. Marseille-P9274 TaxID=2866572 RepID=UPI0021C6FF74|nr:amidohydrolase [Arthrobacter sp. Marseille-P9274]